MRDGLPTKHSKHDQGVLFTYQALYYRYMSSNHQVILTFKSYYPILVGILFSEIYEKKLTEVKKRIYWLRSGVQ